MARAKKPPDPRKVRVACTTCGRECAPVGYDELRPMPRRHNKPDGTPCPGYGARYIYDRRCVICKTQFSGGTTHAPEHWTPEDDERRGYLKADPPFCPGTRQLVELVEIER